MRKAPFYFRLYYIYHFVVVFILLFLLTQLSLSPIQAAFRFVSWSDAQDSGSYLPATSKQVAIFNPNLTIFNGDFEDDGVTTVEMDLMVKAINGDKNGTTNNSMLNKTFLIRGNHDNHQTNSASLWSGYWESTFSNSVKAQLLGVSNYSDMNTSMPDLTYSFDYDNARFIGVDVPGDVGNLTTAQISWIDQRLTDAENRGLIHAFIFFHGPLYCIGYHCSCATVSCVGSSKATDLVSVFNKHPIVSATFHGHEHDIAWTHIAGSRISGTTGTFHEYEQFVTSPSGAGSSSYDSSLISSRVDYAYTSSSDVRRFAVIDVNGLQFTVNFYTVGVSTPNQVWSRTFSKGTTGPTLTPSPTLTISVTPTRTPTPTSANVVSTPTPLLGSIRAFPEAMGWGAGAWQNCDRRNLNVIEVTNLNDSGTGSLRAALTATGPRIVVFKVGGIIKLLSRIDVRDDRNQSCLYVAGQSAPGGGILVTTDPAVTSTSQSSIKIMAHDVILRYIKMRGNNDGNIDIDNAHDVILDHISLSWTTDDSLDIWRGADSYSGPIHNITVQRLTTTEIYNVHSTHANIGGEHAYQYEKQVDNLSLHHNIFGHAAYRFPDLSTLSTSLVNNVMYNWKWMGTITNHAPSVDIIGNYYKPGPMTEWEAQGYPSNLYRYRAINHESTDEFLNPYPENASIYIAQNVQLPEFTNPAADNWGLMWDEFLASPLDPKFKRNPWQPLPAAPFPITVQSPNDAYTSLITNKDVGASAKLDCLGNRVINRDSVDERLLNDVANKTQWFNLTDSGGKPRYPDSLTEVGGYPNIDPGTACADSDHDGMSDVWETAHFGSLNQTASTDFDNDGYTNLEEFLNGTDPGGLSSSPTPTSVCPSGSLGNLNCDSGGLVNETDLSIFLNKWTTTGPLPTPGVNQFSANLNNDIYGKVDEMDLTILLSHWKT